MSLFVIFVFYCNTGSSLKVVRVPIPVLGTRVNDSPARVLLEDSALRVPEGLKGVSPNSPQDTWGLKRLSPFHSPQGT